MNDGKARQGKARGELLDIKNAGKVVNGRQLTAINELANGAKRHLQLIKLSLYSKKKKKRKEEK